jgi:F-type H+-transporting ATPase subunit beta
VIGPVIDVEFPTAPAPIFNALRITNAAISDQPWNLIVEVAQHLGEKTVRTIAMDSTDGLTRGRTVGTPARASACPSASRRLAAS